MTCRHLIASPAIAVDSYGRETTGHVVYLCGWAENEPAAMVDLPPWLQRMGIAGHMLKYPKDCRRCPCREDRR